MWDLWAELGDGLPLTSTYSFPGLLCHLDDACVSNPCHEDAICDTNPVNGRAICTCPPGFTGGACDQDVDECSIGEGRSLRVGKEGRGCSSATHTHTDCYSTLQVPILVSTWAGV